MSFFTDTFFSKVNPYMFKLVGADTGSPAQAKLVDECIALLEKEIEPLLADASPYFGGSDRITIVEVRSDLDPSTSAWLPKFSSLSPFLFLAQFTPSTSTYMPQTPSNPPNCHPSHSLTHSHPLFVFNRP